jgi:hypothetical protein
MNAEPNQDLEQHRQLKHAVYQVLQDWKSIDHEGATDREWCRVSLETMLRLARVYSECRSLT